MGDGQRVELLRGDRRKGRASVGGRRGRQCDRGQGEELRRGGAEGGRDEDDSGAVACDGGSCGGSEHRWRYAHLRRPGDESGHINRAFI